MTRCWLRARPKKARKAAEAIAGYENRFTALDQRLVKIEGDLNQRFAKIEGDIKLLTGMIGSILPAPSACSSCFSGIEAIFDSRSGDAERL
jgi:hypothetical protein